MMFYLNFPLYIMKKPLKCTKEHVEFRRKLPVLPKLSPKILKKRSGKNNPLCEKIT